MFCPNCGQSLPDNSKFCTSCGKSTAAPIQPLQQPIQSSVPLALPQKKPWYKRWYIWVALGVVFNILIIILASATNNIQKTNAEKNRIHWKSELEKIEYIEVDCDILYHNSNEYTDKTILTAVKIRSINRSGKGNIKANISDSTSFFYDLDFEFDDPNELLSYDDDDYVEIFGTVAEKGLISDTLEIKGCHITECGESAEAKYDLLSENRPTDIQESTAVVSEEKKEEQPNNEVDQQNTVAEEEFKNSCESIDYATLARNPDKYKGNNYVFTGKVIQVTESTWYNKNVDLRIDITEESYEYLEGSNWTDTIYAIVEIPDGEDRILEDDIITFWGTCDGMYTYESIFGQKISLPKIDIKYFELRE